MEALLAVLQRHVGGCREELGAPSYSKCGKPAEFVLWGRLMPPEGLGPRCHEHALKHIDRYGVASRSNYALINLRDLAEDLRAEGD